MIALGWTACTTPVPKELTVIEAGKLHVICAPENHTKTPRQRLALQVCYFNRGLDFVPIAPAQTISADAALKIGANLNLVDLLRQNVGYGQLSIALHIGKSPIIDANSGQSWLVMRKQIITSVVQHKDLLQRLAKVTGCRQSAIHQQADNISCDLLVKRKDTQKIKTIVNDLLKTADHLHDTSATVTGLWPPFGFVQLENDVRGAA